MMTTRWQRLFAGIVAGGASLTLVACSGGDPAGSGGDTTAPSTLDVWWYEADDSAMGIAWKAALDQFEAAHPDVTVNFELKSWDQLQQAGQMVLNSDSAPDLLEYPKGNATAGAVAQAGLAADLTDYASQYGWDESVAASALTVGRYDANGVMGSGPLYGIPSYGENVGLFYNADMLTERGIEVPKTMEELEAAMQTFVDDGVTPLALGAADYPIVHLIYELALHDADRQWVDSYQFFQGPVDFHDANWTYAAQTTADWVANGYISADATGIDAENAGNGFKDGTYPFFVSGSWWYGDFASSIDFDWSAELFPGNAMNTGSGGNIWMIPANSDAKDLAAELIDLTLSPDNQALLGNSGGVPVAADPSAVTDPTGNLAVSLFNEIADKDGLSFYSDWPVPGYYDVWLQNAQGLVSGSLTPDQFLDAIGTFYEQNRPADS